MKILKGKESGVFASFYLSNTALELNLFGYWILFARKWQGNSWQDGE